MGPFKSAALSGSGYKAAIRYLMREAYQTENQTYRMAIVERAKVVVSCTHISSFMALSLF